MFLSCWPPWWPQKSGYTFCKIKRMEERQASHRLSEKEEILCFGKWMFSTKREWKSDLIQYANVCIMTVKVTKRHLQTDSPMLLVHVHSEVHVHSNVDHVVPIGVYSFVCVHGIVAAVAFSVCKLDSWLSKSPYGLFWEKMMNAFANLFYVSVRKCPRWCGKYSQDVCGHSRRSYQWAFIKISLEWKMKSNECLNNAIHMSVVAL